MEHLLSDRIKNMSSSPTFAIAAKGRELVAQGKDMIQLTLGQPDFDLPEFIKEAAIKGIHEGYNTYSPVGGYADLIEAIIEKLKRDNDLTYKSSQIAVSTGAKQCLSNLCLTLINDGDEVIIPVPYWVSYKEMTKLACGIPIEVHATLENNYKITPEQLESAITPKTKAMFFGSPSNPSGSIYTKEEMKALADVLAKYPNIIIFSDEIYEYLNFVGRHTSMASFEGMYDRTVTINGLSKSHAMTGWRLGYIAAPEWITKAYLKLQGQLTSGTNSIAQRAAIAALKEPVSKIQNMIDAFKERKEALIKAFKELEGFKISNPDGAFYLLPDVSYYFGKSFNGKTIQSATDLCDFLMDEALVATVPGEAFGVNQCLRISYALNVERLQEAVQRIKKAVALLQ